jgi:RimJ/RimL family protein N-acetyltransferase
MTLIETDRLALRQLDAGDAAFILRLLNDPSWLRYIGDRGVRTLEDARSYIETGPALMYRRFGFGLYLVERKADAVAIGICGLVRRESLPDADLGFAFLPEFRGSGYAFESASAVLDWAGRAKGLTRILAITTADNHASSRLLEKLGFRFEKWVRLKDDAEELRLYAATTSGNGPRPARTSARP